MSDYEESISDEGLGSELYSGSICCSDSEDSEMDEDVEDVAYESINNSLVNEENVDGNEESGEEESENEESEEEESQSENELENFRVDPKIEKELKSTDKKAFKKYLNDKKYMYKKIFKTGLKIGNYEVMELCGRGGCGGVWKCKFNDEICVIKVIFGYNSDAEFEVEMFEKYGVDIIGYKHIEVIWFEGFMCIVMPYLGKSLRKIMKSRYALSRGTVMKMVRDVAETLIKLEKVGLYYTDVKMSNIVYNRDSKKFCLIDFANCKTYVELKDNDTQATGYCAPEVMFNCDDKRKADVWAIGCVIFELLKGRFLFDNVEEDVFDDDYYRLRVIEYLFDCNLFGIYGETSEYIDYLQYWDGEEFEVKSWMKCTRESLKKSMEVCEMLKNCLCVDYRERWDYVQLYNYVVDNVC